MTAGTRSGVSVNVPTLYVAFDLGKKSWMLGMTSGFGAEVWVRGVDSGDWGAVNRVLAEGRRRFQLAEDAPVVSCYEAGRDGFWIHRALVVRGVANRVVDSASLEVNRRARRAKTDRVDARKLVAMLVRVCGGERRVWSEVRVPTVAQEAARHVSRERTTLTQEHTRTINQMRGWLATWGARLPSRQGAAWWTQVRDWTGAPLPIEVQGRLARAAARVAMLEAQIETLERQQRAAVTAAPSGSPAWRLLHVKGLGVTSVSTLLQEGLVWREFRNRREIGGVLGFAPTPYASGETTREQGISRAGNARLQSLAIQLAWSWVRWQPTSRLTQWYLARFGTGKRARRIGIVALARKLVIALWRCATTGAVPEGAVLRVAAA